MGLKLVATIATRTQKAPRHRLGAPLDCLGNVGLKRCRHDLGEQDQPSAEVHRANPVDACMDDPWIAPVPGLPQQRRAPKIDHLGFVCRPSTIDVGFEDRPEKIIVCDARVEVVDEPADRLAVELGAIESLHEATRSRLRRAFNVGSGRSPGKLCACQGAGMPDSAWHKPGGMLASKGHERRLSSILPQQRAATSRNARSSAVVVSENGRAFLTGAANHHGWRAAP